MTPQHPGIGTPTSLIRCETDDPSIFAFVIFFPSGAQLQIVGRSETKIQPTVDAAKQYAITIVQKMLDRGWHDDLDRTNQSSVVAAIQKMIDDFNETKGTMQ